MTTMKEIQQVITDLIHHLKHNEYNDAVVNMQYKGLVHMIEDYAAQQKPVKEPVPLKLKDLVDKCMKGYVPSYAELWNNTAGNPNKFYRAMVNGYTVLPDDKEVNEDE